MFLPNVMTDLDLFHYSAAGASPVGKRSVDFQQFLGQSWVVRGEVTALSHGTEKTESWLFDMDDRYIKLILT